MTSEQRIAEWLDRLDTGLIDTDSLALVRAALPDLIASVRAEVIEECLRKYRDVMSERLNLHYEQRIYGWHDLQWAMEESEKDCRALVKERKG